MAYSTKAIAELLDWTPARVRRFVRNGLIEPNRTSAGFRFEFADLVLLRTAHQLESQAITPRNLLQALRTLRSHLPDGRALSTVKLAARGRRLLVSEGSLTWEPGSGQLELLPDTHEPAEVSNLPRQEEPKFHDQYNQAIDMEAHDVDRAMGAYEAVLKAEPNHHDARINLGRLQQERGELSAARQNYEAVLRREPDNSLALFNLGTVAEAQGDTDNAISYYQQAADFVSDAHFNLARLFEAQGQLQLAIRHLRQFQKSQPLWQQDDLDHDEHN